MEEWAAAGDKEDHRLLMGEEDMAEGPLMTMVMAAARAAVEEDVGTVTDMEGHLVEEVDGNEIADLVQITIAESVIDHVVEARTDGTIADVINGHKQ